MLQFPDCRLEAVAGYRGIENMLDANRSGLPPEHIALAGYYANFVCFGTLQKRNAVAPFRQIC